MALSANVHLQHREAPCLRQGKIGAAGTYYKGSLLCWDANGLLVKCADTAAYTFAGVLKQKVVVVSGVVDVELEKGTFRIPFASASQVDVGEDFYATGDDLVAKTATNISKAGLCIDFETGYVWLDMFDRRA